MLRFSLDDVLARPMDRRRVLSTLSAGTLFLFGYSRARQERPSLNFFFPPSSFISLSGGSQVFDTNGLGLRQDTYVFSFENEVQLPSDLPLREHAFSVRGNTLFADAFYSSYPVILSSSPYAVSVEHEPLFPRIVSIEYEIVSLPESVQTDLGRSYLVPLVGMKSVEEHSRLLSEPFVSFDKVRIFTEEGEGLLGAIYLFFPNLFSATVPERFTDYSAEYPFFPYVHVKREDDNTLLMHTCYITFMTGLNVVSNFDRFRHIQGVKIISREYAWGGIGEEGVHFSSFTSSPSFSEGYQYGVVIRERFSLERKVMIISFENLLSQYDPLTLPKLIWRVNADHPCLEKGCMLPWQTKLYSQERKVLPSFYVGTFPLLADFFFSNPPRRVEVRKTKTIISPKDLL